MLAGPEETLQKLIVWGTEMVGVALCTEGSTVKTPAGQYRVLGVS